MGKGGAGQPPCRATPFRSVPHCTAESPPPTLGRGRGADGAGPGALGTFLGPGPGLGALMIPGQPVKAGDGESVLKVGREAVEG